MLGIALGLTVLLLSVLALAGLGWKLSSGGAVDGEERLAALLRTAEPPFGLELAEALRTPDGAVLLRLERVDEVPAPDAPLPPREVVLAELPSAAAARALFAEREEGRHGPRGKEGGEDVGHRLREWREDPSFDWRATLEHGELPWGPWFVPLRVERLFHAGGSWHEAARLDLSRPGRWLVLVATWPEGDPLDRRALEGLLRALERPEPEG